MGKLLLLVIFGVVVWWLWRMRQLRRPATPAVTAARPAEAMVACAHCGVNQPRSECVEQDGVFYCSQAHRLAARRRGES
jgi:uncharacterized protein